MLANLEISRNTQLCKCIKVQSLVFLCALQSTSEVLDKERKY